MKYCTSNQRKKYLYSPEKLVSTTLMDVNASHVPTEMRLSDAFAIFDFCMQSFEVVKDKF